VAGDSLLGVVAFGSWARGEAGARSDVDLLVVVERRVEIGRRLYQRWDEAPVSWNGRRVEPHFVHLPERGAHLSGLWAEVATDGVVLFDRGLVVSRLLVAYRHEIMAGRLVRRTVHGQTYWVEAA
jgi:hypothetical protein